MKLISWNVNGLRAVVTKGFKEFFDNVDADIFCLQETKLQEEQVDKNIKSIFNGYNEYWNYAEKKGYSGTAVFSKIKPINVIYGIGIEEHDKEGRVITLEIDLKNPKTNHRNAGFTDEERDKMTKLLNAGFTDSFRYLYPEKEGCYSWWSYMFHAREKNAGWRIDYFIVSNSINKNIKESKIYSDIMGSDHCPVGIEIEI